MTSRPGVAVALQTLATPVSVPLDTGTWFATGTADRGPSSVATLIQNLDQFVTVYGARQSYSILYDAVETFFREGGSRVYIGRVVGPAATSGFLNLNDAVAAISLVATANGPGAWSNQIKVGVVAGGTGGSFQIQITDLTNNVLEQSSDLFDQGSAIAWSQYSNYIRLTLGASINIPANIAPVVLSTGNDDRTNITDTQWANALALFSYSLGPGQVSAPGRTTSTSYGQIKAHVENFGRVGILDLPDSATLATLQSAAAGVVSRFCAAFCPWIVVPGVTTGTSRIVPPCGMIAGLCARNDPSAGTNQPSAGNYGVARFGTDLSQPDWNDLQRTTLNSSSCNVIRRLFGGLRNYGWRALVNAVGDPSWVDFGNGRFYVDIAAELDAIGENFVFSQIDGQNGQTITQFHDQLYGNLLDHYNAGQLFGDTPQEAFDVNTGPGVNTLTTLANNELHAVCTLKISPMAEFVQINIVKLMINQSVN